MSRKLLVIDDEPGVTAIVENIAPMLDLNVMAVREPSDAIDAFIDFQPDLVLLDIVMPEVDGIDILHDIMLSGIPTTLVLMCGFSDAYVRIAQGVASFHGAPPLQVLRKPFRRDDLAILLREMLPG